MSLRRTVVYGKISPEVSLTFPLILVCAVAIPPVQNTYIIIIRCNTLFMTSLISDGKDSANRVEKKQVCLIFYPEVQPMLFKDSANGRHRNIVLLKLCFESALILVK